MDNKKLEITKATADIILSETTSKDSPILERVTKKCHISKKTIYHFFEDKSELIMTAFNQSGSKMLKEIDDLNVEVSDVDQFTTVMEEVLNWVRAFYIVGAKEMSKHRILVDHKLTQIAEHLKNTFFKSADDEYTKGLRAFVAMECNDYRSNPFLKEQEVLVLKKCYPVLLHQKYWKK